MAAVVELPASAATVRVIGQWRAPGTDALRRAVTALLVNGERNILLDLAALTDLNAAGIGELVNVSNMARTFPRLLRLRATLGPDGEPLVDGLPWNSSEVATRVEAAVAPGATLARFDGPDRFDILPLLICTDGAVSMFGRDLRRLRPNILIGGVDGAGERPWPGATLRLPQACSATSSVGLADDCASTRTSSMQVR